MMEAIFGAELVTAGGDVVTTDSRLAGVQRVCVLVVDSVLGKCKKLSAAMRDVYSEVNAAEKRMEVVVLSVDDTEEAAAAGLADAPWTAVPFRSPAADRLRKLLGMTAVVLPQLIVLDGSGNTLSTDGADAVQRGDISATTFPNWRTNVLHLQVDDGPATAGAVVHPETLLRCGLYPGDSAVLHVRQRKTSVAVYVNPPASERDCTGGADDDITPSTLPRDVISVPQCVALALGATGDVVSLQRLLSPPEARRVKVCVSGNLESKEAESMEVLCKHFGLECGGDTSTSDNSTSIVLAMLAAEGVDAATIDVAHLRGFITKRRCRYQPLQTGQRLFIRDESPECILEEPHGDAPDSSGAADSGDAADSGGAADGSVTVDSGGATSHMADSAALASNAAVSGTDAVAVASAKVGDENSTQDTAVSRPLLSAVPRDGMHGVSKRAWHDFRVVETVPRGTVIVAPTTVLQVVVDPRAAT